MKSRILLPLLMATAGALAAQAQAVISSGHVDMALSRRALLI